MSNIDIDAGYGPPSAAAEDSRPRRRRTTVAGYLGRSVLTGVFLAASAAIFPVAAIYSFIWLAQIN